MARVIVDRELRSWEVFASTGPYGYADRGRIVFHCLTDPRLEARAAEVDGDHGEAERLVATLPDRELLEMLEGSGALA